MSTSDSFDRANGVTSSRRRTSPVVDPEVVPRARGRHGRTQVDISTISSGSHPYAYFMGRQRRKTTGAGAYPFDAHALRFTSESSLCIWTGGAAVSNTFPSSQPPLTCGREHLDMHLWTKGWSAGEHPAPGTCGTILERRRVLVAPLHRVPLSSSPLEFEPLHPSRIDRAPKGPHM